MKTTYNRNLSGQLAKRIRALRGDQTQREFAKRVGITHATLNRIEQQTQNVTLKTLQLMCDRLRCGAGYLFGEED